MAEIAIAEKNVTKSGSGIVFGLLLDRRDRLHFNEERFFD